MPNLFSANHVEQFGSLVETKQSICHSAETEGRRVVVLVLLSKEENSMLTELP